ncbi:MAG: cob(I)yrinic acid a,c-diamide adenosyltransferase [Planctomycetota bacterium]
MVRLTKIYTRTGDGGETGLGDGSRVAKTDPRVEAYGTVDEANAALGLSVLACGDAGTRALLVRIQNDLFDVGADLCTPLKAGEHVGDALRVTGGQTSYLEGEIDRVNADLESLTSFVLPGGSELAARLHIARTIVRRAERRVIEFAESEPGAAASEPIRYLNRLSDLLFVLARAANAGPDGGGDVLWVPGSGREAPEGDETEI